VLIKQTAKHLAGKQQQKQQRMPQLQFPPAITYTFHLEHAPQVYWALEWRDHLLMVAASLLQALL